MTASTIDQQSDLKVRLQSMFEQYSGSLNGHRHNALLQLQKQALEQVLGMEFPTRRDEDWKYTSVAPLLKQDYREALVPAKIDPEWAALPGITALQMVFSNGKLIERPQQLPEGLEVYTLSEALDREDLQEAVSAQLYSGKAANAFIPLNNAFNRDGLVIRLAADAVITTPLHLAYLTSPGPDPLFMHPNVLVLAGVNSQFTLIESYRLATAVASPYFNNSVNRMVLKAGAQVQHYKLQLEGENGFQINQTSAVLGRDSVYSHFTLDLGGSLVRNNVNIHLGGENGNANLYGIYLANEKQHIDNQTFIDHAVPNCLSNELYKGIITDQARGVFNGKVLVRQDAQKTNAYQQNSNLVLSKTAAMDTKPQLEIFADDVKCSHGATIGQLDEDHVFYLRTRGLNETQARAMLQHAFLGEVGGFIGQEGIREYVNNLLSDKFAR